MKLYKDDGKQSIEGDSPVDVTLDDVLTEIDSFPTEDEHEGGYIGLINDKNETIQFLRYEKNIWLIDIPMVKDGKYRYSLQNGDLITDKVKEIIRRFFREEDWKSLCNLMKV